MFMHGIAAAGERA